MTPVSGSDFADTRYAKGVVTLSLPVLVLSNVRPVCYVASSWLMDYGKPDGSCDKGMGSFIFVPYPRLVRVVRVSDFYFIFSLSLGNWRLKRYNYIVARAGTVVNETRVFNSFRYFQNHKHKLKKNKKTTTTCRVFIYISPNTTE